MTEDYLTTRKLGDFAVTQTGPFGSQLHEEDYVEIGTPIVTVEHLGDIGFTTQNLPFVSERDTERLEKYKMREGDIIFSRVGSVDRSVYVSAKEDGWLFSGRCLRVRCDDTVNPQYLAYYFRLPSFKSMMLKLAVGATMPSLNTEIMDSVKVLLPDIICQERAAKILSTIDAKIDNNNAICADLEAMTKLLYDYWFVQFDFPDENGKPYKSSGGKMVWNEKLKREIPEGWKVKVLDSMITLERGISYSSSDLVGNGIPMINLGSFAIGGGYKNDNLKFYDGKYAERKIVKPYDLIICLTQQTNIDPKKDVIGCAMLVPDIFSGDIVMSQDLAKIACAESLKYYLFYYFNTSYFHKYITGYATGSNIIHLDVNGILRHFAIVPPIHLLERYTRAVKGAWNYKSICMTENQQLASLRDFLLPMLMNGQVKVG